MIIKGLLSQKRFYIVLIALLIIWIQEDKLVLNVPMTINVMLFITPFLLLFSYSLKDRNDKTYSVSENLIASGGGAFFVFIIMKLMMTFNIKKYSENQKVITMSTPVCNITSSRRQDFVHFYFKGEKYSLRYSNEKRLKKDDLVNNYNIELSYSQSVFDTYVIKNYRIFHK